MLANRTNGAILASVNSEQSFNRFSCYCCTAGRARFFVRFVQGSLLPSTDANFLVLTSPYRVLSHLVVFRVMMTIYHIFNMNSLSFLFAHSEFC